MVDSCFIARNRFYPPQCLISLCLFRYQFDYTYTIKTVGRLGAWQPNLTTMNHTNKWGFEESLIHNNVGLSWLWELTMDEAKVPQRWSMRCGQWLASSWGCFTRAVHHVGSFILSAGAQVRSAVEWIVSSCEARHSVELHRWYGVMVYPGKKKLLLYRPKNLSSKQPSQDGGFLRQTMVPLYKPSPSIGEGFDRWQPRQHLIHHNLSFKMGPRATKSPKVAWFGHYMNVSSTVNTWFSR